MAAEELQLLHTIASDFLDSRKLQLVGVLPDDDSLSHQVMVSPGYVRINAESAPESTPKSAERRLVVIYFLGTGSKYMLHGNDLDVLLRQLENENTAAELQELILVTPDVFFTKSNLLEIFKRHAEASSAYYNPQPYHRFSMNLLKSVLVSPHRIMSESEVKLTFKYGEKKTDLPVILITDPVVLWIGARIGQVVEVTRWSASTGHAITYYRVK